MTHSGPSRELSRILTIMVVVVVVAALFLAKVVLLPLALAILLAFLLSPLVSLLERVKLPRVLAILLVLAAVFVLIGAGGWSVGKQLVQIANELPSYRVNIAAKVAEFHHTKNSDISRTFDKITRLGEEVGLSDARVRWERPGSSPNRPLSVQEVPSTGGGTLDTLHGVVRKSIEVLLVVVFAFFMLLEREDLRNRLIRVTGRGDLHRKTEALDEASRRVSRYFVLLLTVNVSYGAIVFLALHLIGLPHALLFGALTVMLRFIPYIGAPIAALLPILLAAAVFRGWQQTFEILGVFLVVEIVTANYIEPRLYGKHTGLSPLAVLVAAVFWTLIWGPVGLLLSVPLTVCLVVVGSHVSNLEFLAVLLGDEPILLASTHYYQRLLAGDEREAGEVLDAYLRDKPIEDLYDSVLIPALELAEHDRHSNKLDDTTASFVYRTTRELIGELGLRTDSDSYEDRSHGSSRRVTPEIGPSVAPSNLEGPLRSSPEVLCVPVRDEADEIAAIMLVQLLTREGHFARATRIQAIEDAVREINESHPDLVFLSALAPFAVAHARGVYKALRQKWPHLKILIGLWNSSENEYRAAREISQGEQDHLYATLSEAVAEADRTTPARPPLRRAEPDFSLTKA